MVDSFLRGYAEPMCVRYQGDGHLGFADTATVEFPDLAGLFSNSHGPAEMLSLRPRFRNAGEDSFAENLVFELRVLRRNAKRG
jgi:hypothetical protein